MVQTAGILAELTACHGDGRAARRGFHSDVYSMIDEVVAWILSKSR